MKQFVWILVISAFFAQACAYTIKIKDGQTAFDQKQYAVAIPFLKKEFNKTKSPAKQGKIAFMLGESYRITGQPATAADWFAKAYAKSYGPDALKAQALALKQKGDYEMAMVAFQELGREIGSPYEYRREVNACQDAIDWLKTEKKQGVTIERPDFNSSSNDFAPAIFKDDQLVFVSDRNAATGDKNYAWTGRKFTDLFVQKDGVVAPFDPSLNTPFNEGPVCFNQDFSELILTRCDQENDKTINCRLFSCKWDGAHWSAPIPLAFQENGNNYIHPALSKDGNTLYFASDHKDGWGGYDLYFSERTNTGWSPPQLLSRIINTIGDEVFPTLEEDTLYFSSNYLGGMGGLDLFKSTKTGPNQWTPPKNLKSPINSPGDDFGLVVTQTGNGKDFLKEGYISSNRNGQDDILFFRKKTVPKPPVEKPKEITYKNFLKVISLEKIYADPDNPSSKVLGRKPLAEVELTIFDGKNTQKVTTNEYGEYEFELGKDVDYSFTGSKPDFLKNMVTYSSKGFGKDPENPVQHYELELVLDKIFKNKEIRLENIYYDFNKWDIREDAKPSLDKLAAMLLENPDIKIELASHTDCRGGEKYNRELSQKRADSAISYLISKGIDATRLVARGYGKSQPAVNCVCSKCTEEEHQFNRRTTFKIL
ncbi:MAG TPA: flagellar motor protein MotB [Saprospiraceae bacterium]|nr:flagellar motor protein MotB [Saprospiraceae bacterium]